MATLFKLPDKIQPEPHSNHRCRTCDHMFTHEYNKGFKYCTKQKSKRTLNGFRKVKANDFGCELHTRNN